MFRKLAPLPFVLFGSLAALLVGGRMFMHAGEHRDLETRLGLASEYVTQQVENLIEGHISRTAQFGLSLLTTGEIKEARFRRLAAQYQKQHPGLQAWNFVEPSGIVRWVEPEVGNRSIVGFDLSKHPSGASAFRAALSGSEVELTAPLELVQGGWGIAAYYNVQHNGKTYGLVNGAFRFSDVLANCLKGEHSSQFSFELRQGEHSLASFGQPPAPSQESSAVDSVLRIHGQEFTLRVTPAPLATGHGSWVDEVLLAISLLLAALMVWMAQVAHIRRLNAEVIAERLRVGLANAPDAILTLDANTGRVLDANRRAFELFGHDPEALMGLMPGEMSPTAQPNGRPSQDEFAERIAAARAGESTVFEWTIQDVNGKTCLTEVHLVAMPGGNRSTIRASIMDISRRRKLEDDLRRTHVHEAIGQLAGGVAHDFNNMLTAILGASELLADRIKDDPKSVELALCAVETCQRAGTLTQKLLAFSRNAPVKPQVLSVNQVIAGLTPMLTRVLSNRIHLRTELTATSTILADPAQLELALLNLIVNARDSMPDGGEITISSANIEGESVSIRVQDQGMGIREEILDRVFEPFFTTKGHNTGTGIGLATVRQIVDQAHGTIRVESELGVGTTFVAEFPIHGGEPVRSLIPSARPLARGKGRVLVVEDNGEVRSIIQRVLRSAGFEVLAATNAEDALRLSSVDRRSFDLVITSAVLPGVDGLELVRELRGLHPELMTLIISSYPTQSLGADQPGSFSLQFLAKPFSPSELMDKVHEILSRTPTDA